MIYFVQLGLSDCPCIAGACKVVLGPWLLADLCGGFSPAVFPDGLQAVFAAPSSGQSPSPAPQSISRPTEGLQKEHET